MRIGLPLDGWDLAVVDPQGHRVPDGEPGELIIGGVGLARYLDPAKDASVYAAMPTLGWDRAYRSGDIVRFDGEGLVFHGRADDQVKVGGRRIELGEVDSALLGLPGVSGAAAAVRRSEAGNSLLVGYVTDRARLRRQGGRRAPPPLDAGRARPAPRRRRHPADPHLGEDRPRRAALAAARTTGLHGIRPGPAGVDGTAAWVAGHWSRHPRRRAARPRRRLLRPRRREPHRRPARRRLRERFPEVTVADVYDHPGLADLAAALDDMATPTGRQNAAVLPVPLRTQVAQVLGLAGRSARSAPCAGSPGSAVGAWSAATVFGLDWLPDVGWGWVLARLAAARQPSGPRAALAAAAARLALAGVRAGTHPRGGMSTCGSGSPSASSTSWAPSNLSAAPLVKLYARLLGCEVGRHVDLHSVPPVTGMLHPRQRLLHRARGRPRRPLARRRRPAHRCGPGRCGRRVGARSTLLPGADVGARAEVAPGSAVFGPVPDDESWSGAPATFSGAARGPWTPERPPKRPVWVMAYAASAVVLASLPGVAVLAGVALALPALSGTQSLDEATAVALLAIPVAVPVALLVLAGLVLALVRLLSLGLEPGAHAVHGLRAWQAWSVLRVLDESRTWLFPLYSSALTPAWLRALGADIGSDVEASTVLMIPRFVRVGEGAFLADDTLVGGYELGGGWLRVERVRVGKGAFVGNSGMAAPGRKVPRQALVAVLSAAPRRGAAKAGTSWLGSPPRPLRREAGEVDAARTHAPPRRLRVARALVEVCRVVPEWAHAVLVVLVASALLALLDQGGWWAVGSGGLVHARRRRRCGRRDDPRQVGPRRAHAALGAPACGARSSGATSSPTPSSRSWRPRGSPGPRPVRRSSTSGSVRWAPGSAGACGARRYWLPEADLIELREGATVGRGCVVQTHLFHDRILSMDRVTIADGGTLGPNSRDPAGRSDRSPRYRRPGLARHARRIGAGQDTVDRQPCRTVDGGRE